ncbi:MAG: UPF0175 family protein [Thiolinea sp.]
MYATNVRELKKNPSLALRQAQDSPVLIMKGNQPDALLVHLESSMDETLAHIRPAIAAGLYRDALVSLGKAAKISGLSMSEFIQHLGDLGIDIVRHDETVDAEVKDVTQWLSS